MSEDTRHWSCYTATQARSLQIFEGARPRCPLARGDEHDGFHMLLLRRTPDLKVQTGAPAYQFGGGDYSYLPALAVSFTVGAREA